MFHNMVVQHHYHTKITHGASTKWPQLCRYLIGCDNELAKLHTVHPELCDKVGGFILMHIDDLRKFAPLWLSKTEEVRNDRDHWSTNITGDVYGKGWISEMYGYSFGAAEVALLTFYHQLLMYLDCSCSHDLLVSKQSRLIFTGNWATCLGYLS